jgi:hypothetical protein
MTEATMTTLGQSAFDYLVEEAVREALADSEFNYFQDVTPNWVSQTLPDFYSEGWDALTDDQKLDVVDELSNEVNESFRPDR